MTVVRLGSAAIAAYLVLSFGAFWLATPLATTSPALPVLVASFAPGLSAILVTAVAGGRGGVRSLLATLVRWRVGPWWYLASIGIPVIATLGMVAANVALGGTPAGDVAAVLPLAPLIILFAAGEELGWRGLLLPQLLARFPALAVAVVLGGTHAAYHLPLWVADGMRGGSCSFLSFATASVGFGIVWTWLYLGTGGSVLLTTLFHGSINVAGNALLGGIPSTQLDLLLPLFFGVAGVLVLAWSGPALQRERG